MKVNDCSPGTTQANSYGLQFDSDINSGLKKRFKLLLLIHKYKSPNNNKNLRLKSEILMLQAFRLA